jgi:DNA-binding NtrC family response regulator
MRLRLLSRIEIYAASTRLETDVRQKLRAVLRDQANKRALSEMVSDFERGLILEMLRRNDGDVVGASEALRIPKKPLYDKMRRYALSGSELR